MENFKVKNVSDSFIRKLANCYTADIRITFQMLGAYFNICQKTVSKLLYRGIAEDIIPDAQAELIYHKVVHVNCKHKAQRAERWKKAFDERIELRKRKLAEAKQVAKSEKVTSASNATTF